MKIEHLSIQHISEMLEEQEPTRQLLKSMQEDHRSGVQRLLEKYYRKQDALRKKREKAEKMLIEEQRLWAEGYTLLGGIDEVGRGPLAGPVVAACVVLPKGLIIEDADDSKKLTPAKREELFEQITQEAEAVGIGVVDHTRIDEINIYHATIEAMIQALEHCNVAPEFLLIDAMHLKAVSLPQLPLIGGDGKSQTIAAASIIAKVARDRMMTELAEVYPGYGFEKHKGYCTDEHVAAIRALGVSPIHRRSFMNKILTPNT